MLLKLKQLPTYFYGSIKIFKINFPGKTNRVSINNLDVVTLKKLINFVYTDNFDPDNANLIDLVNITFST